MRVFAQMAKHLQEHANGKIHVLPNGYCFDSKHGKPMAFKSVDGRTMFLLRSVRSANNCPKPPGDHPVTLGGAWVPMTECCKCPMHIPRFRGQAYPCCKLLREQRAKGPSPTDTMNDMVQSAVDETNKLLPK